MTSPAIRILLADDHALIREALRQILNSCSSFEVVGEAANAAGTIELVRSTQAQILILDLSMPDRNGIEVIRVVKDIEPALRILVLTMHGEHQYAVRAFKAGASGYLTKESASGELVSALTKIANGGVYMSLAMAERFALNLHEPPDTLPHQCLSDRELAVFRRITAGETIGEIAAQLCVSTKTVSTYKARILEKMRMPHAAALVRYAMRHKLFGDSEEL